MSSTSRCAGASRRTGRNVRGAGLVPAPRRPAPPTLPAMTFDPIAWAARHGAVPGSPVDQAPAVTSVGAMFVDTHSLLCAVDPDLAAVTVEARLREDDLTLGLFPERYE